MKKNTLTFLFFIVTGFLLMMQSALFSGCATIIPPPGGPRDSLPPVLAKASPDNGTVNFKEKSVTLRFDEYIDVDNPFTNVIVSPIPKSMPVITKKLNEVYIKIKDTLEEGTTYTIDFGKALKDVNEGNVAKNFTYIFSTASYIDSLQFKGNIILAETGTIDSTLTVILHRNPEDSAVSKEKPRYVTKVDSAGYFNFKYLAPGVYYPYVLKDEGGSYLYFDSTSLFAFADEPVIVGENTPELTLYAYAYPPVQEAGTGGTVASGRGKNEEKRLRFTANVTKGAKFNLLDTIVFTFQVPLKTFDSSKIRLTIDSTYELVKNYYWESDSLQQKYTLIYEWEENAPYHFIIEKDFATDTLGQQLLKGDTLSFSTMALEDYGSFEARFKNLDLSKNPVLQVLQNKVIKYSFPLTGTSVLGEMLLPGDYQLQLLEDRNKNGKWDPGKFFGEKVQPELVQPIKRALNIKANWKSEVEIEL